MTISVFNTTDIQPENRVDYHKQNGQTSGNGVPENKYVPFTQDRELEYIALGGLALPIGLSFLNTELGDKAVYVVKEVKKGLMGLVREDGGKILLNKTTAKNGRMVLKHLTFRGKNLNQQYNVVSNPYQRAAIAEEGKKLSIIAG